jgi:lipopolysaccharide transport system ATP-binding protein
MHAALRAEHLSKYYRIGANAGGEGYGTLRERLMNAATAPVRHLSRRLGRSAAPDAASTNEPDGIWSLNDVSFQVEPGEAVAIIGRNGAGKSTLLKVLARITAPTSGRALLWGRVGCLLEVGTGFHPELTGRENILLNGAVLGMSRREVLRKFDQIVSFAEIGRFLDTPVKRYSSGMYTRLAFAVASHLEPEILIVDEVLAVGDAAFQKKCLGKMDEVTRSGRTVLFVSHNMAAVKSLCGRAILLEQGRIVKDAGVDEVVNAYLSTAGDVAHSGEIPDDAARLTNGRARLRSVGVTDVNGTSTSQLYFGQPFRVTLTCDVLQDIEDGLFEVSISATDGTHVMASTTIDGGRPGRLLKKGRHHVIAEFQNNLLPRQYMVDLGVHQKDGTTADFVQRTCSFTVLKVAEFGTDHYPWPQVRGFARMPASWEVACNGDEPMADGAPATGNADELGVEVGRGLPS